MTTASQSNSSAAGIRLRQGVVIKNKMDKTVVVEVVRKVRHPKYHKFIKRRARFVAHDEGNECNLGDTVSLVETRPMSKTKRWRVKEITVRSSGV